MNEEGSTQSPEDSAELIETNAGVRCMWHVLDPSVPQLPHLWAMIIYTS
jgi:hypothetical protein